jgi:hypothetical protein
VTGLQNVCAFRGDHFSRFKAIVTRVPRPGQRECPSGDMPRAHSQVKLALDWCFRLPTGRLHAAIETGLPWPTPPTPPTNLVAPNLFVQGPIAHPHFCYFSDMPPLSFGLNGCGLTGSLPVIPTSHPSLAQCTTDQNRPVEKRDGMLPPPPIAVPNFHRLMHPSTLGRHVWSA